MNQVFDEGLTEAQFKESKDQQGTYAIGECPTKNSAGSPILKTCPSQKNTDLKYSIQIIIYQGAKNEDGKTMTVTDAEKYCKG